MRPGDPRALTRRRTRASALLALVAAATGTAACGAPERPAWEPARTWALFVGVLEWRHPSLASFPKEGRVDRVLEKTLLARGVPPSQVTFLEDGAATLDACRTALARVARAAGPGSTMVVYYAGHGLQEGTKTYFAPVDADPEDPASSAWAVDDIRKTLVDSWKGSRLLLLADCCHSGALGEVVATYERSTDVGAAMLASTLDCNLSTGRWTFTESAVAILEGQGRVDGDGDDAIDFAEADAFVRRQMRFREDQLTEGLRTSAFPKDLVLARVAPARRRARTAGPWQEGDHVEVSGKGGWRRAEVASATGERARVRYVRPSAPAEEDVPLGRIRAPRAAPIAEKPGDPVEIEWRGTWWPGTVVSVRDDFAFVHYVGWGPEWDEWVPAKRLRPPSR